MIILLRLLHCHRWLNTGNFFPGVKKTKSDYAKSKLATWKNSHTILCFAWIFQQVINIYSLEKVCNNWIFVKHVAQIKSFWSNRMAFSLKKTKKMQINVWPCVMSWYIEIKVKLCLIDLVTIVETILTTATTQDQPRRVKIVIRSTLPCDSLDCIKKPILA